jgi:hypothetical protein
MNADIPPLKVWIDAQHISDGEDFEQGYAFAIQSYKGRALQFHVLMESGAHFRHIPLHWLNHTPNPENLQPLPQLQLWDCFSYKPIVTVFDMLRDYQCNAILKDKTVLNAQYWFSIDWLPDSDTQSGFLLQPDQNKLAHVLLLANGQIAALPTNRIAFKDAFYIGDKPEPQKRGYRTIPTVWKSEDCNRWSVADNEEVYY